MTDYTRDENYRREWALEILKLLVARKNHFVEVLRITKELGDALDRNDRISIEMLLKMRATELEDIDKTVIGVEAFKEQLLPQTQQEIERLLHGQMIDEMLPEMEKIIETSTSCRKILQDIVALDKRMSMRIAGKDSFYKK